MSAADPQPRDGRDMLIYEELVWVPPILQHHQTMTVTIGGRLVLRFPRAETSSR